MVNRKVQVWLPLLFSVVMVLGMTIGYKLRENTSMPGFFKMSNKSPMQEVIDLIQMKYVDPVKTDTLGNKAIQEMLSRLDPHSIYIPATRLTDINDELRGNFSGIGVEFQLFYDTVNVLNVLKNGPSDLAGIQVGDKIIAVNDTSKIAGVKIKPDNIRKLLRGERGSEVKVTVFRDGRLKPFTIKRGTIPTPSVDVAYMITPETGFIHINMFNELTYREFMQSMEKLQASGMKKLIVDLRGNGGGLLNQAVKIADEFLDGNKLVVYTEGTHVPKYEYRCQRDGLFETGALTMLVDESSASASEVLSGALQDWDRATIIGRRTFGKGLVQEQFGLSDGSGLRLTVARYFTPLGRNIQKPYNKGYSAYEEEVYTRFHNGEVVRGDSTATSEPFKTKKGRTVYGGGGITPDIFVPYDTTALGTEASRLYTKGTLSNFIYSYYIQNKSRFTSYKTPLELSSGFKTTNAEWNALKDFAARDSIDLNKVTTKDREDLFRRIPPLMARQIWRYEGYYEVMNNDDEFVKKALAVLKS
ncbi:S41 family peptidase [Segetibacter sp. 3557_3]|uniref:S41 family peptidase n=1 Tax=Segetibacter sp. 3557_3 TaxID=2547429 RepID=UPI001058C0B5|nr:S41 family peptidase [Segetibacter sp. 3557_3]TDH27422.1 S41 family peptidase [Segetibacter sp. 3557_3]